MFLLLFLLLFGHFSLIQLQVVIQFCRWCITSALEWHSVVTLEPLLSVKFQDAVTSFNADFLRCNRSYLNLWWILLSISVPLLHVGQKVIDICGLIDLKPLYNDFLVLI